MRLRLAELIAALSLATDLGLGLPQEHVLRQCRIALGLAERVGRRRRGGAGGRVLRGDAGVGRLHRRLLRALRAVRRRDRLPCRRQPPRELAGLPLIGLMLRRVGDGRGPLRRAQLAATLMATGGRAASRGDDRALPGRGGDRGAPRASAPRCSSRCCTSSRAGTARAGRPAQGEALPLAIRLVHIAMIAEVHHRIAGVEGAIAVSRARSGGQFDPRLASGLRRLRP